MQTNDSNKAMTEDFFFPEQGITVSATSREEADIKLKEILKVNKDKSNE